MARRTSSRKGRRPDINAADHDTKRAYAKFALELIAARKDAENEAHNSGKEVEVDITRAAEVLKQYPKLTRYLDGIREREEARAIAKGETVPSAYATPGQRGFTPDFLRAAPTSSTPHDMGVATFGGQKNQPIGVGNSRMLREWADTNEWVRAAINVRRIQIGRADIMATPADERKKYDKKILKQVQQLLDQPNELRDSYRSLIEPVIEDILVLDRGVISKSMDAKRIPHALYAEDGATIKIYPGWSGKDNEPRYLYEEPGGSRKVPLRNDEAIVIMANPATYRYGRSPVEVLQNTIRADLRATQSAMAMVDMKPPPHLIQIPGISQTVLDKMKAMYEAEVAGHKEMMFLGGQEAAHVFPLVFSARDNQWMEWQVYLARKIAIVFQISPQQFGLTFDINRATAQQQQEIFEDTGLIPLLLLLEEYLNRELLADFAPPMSDAEWRHDLDTLNLRIIYPEVSEASRQMHAEKALEMAVKGLAGLPSMTLNQVLAMRGEEPVRGGNTYWALIGQNVIPIASYDGDLGVYADVMIGEQDSAGGPSLMEPPKPTDETPGKRRVPKPSDASGDDGTANAPSFSDSSGSANDGDSTKSVRDIRPAGKLWRPGMQLASKVPVANLRDIDDIRSLARQTLLSGVKPDASAQDP